MKKEELNTNEFIENENDKIFMDILDPTFEVSKINKVEKDLKKEIKSLKNITRSEIRILVDTMYQLQKMRIRLESQIRAINSNSDEATKVTIKILEWNFDNILVQEEECVKCLKLAVESSPVGRWLLEIKGIGPIMAANLIAYFDVSKCNYATHFISYAGINDNNRPWLGAEKSKQIVDSVLGKRRTITDNDLTELSIRTKWSFEYLSKSCTTFDKKGNMKRSKDDLIKAISKIPYNKELKKIMYILGTGFIKNGKRKEPSTYALLYQQRKVYETEKNERGDYADQAKNILKTKNIGKNTEAYKAYSQGKLPESQIHMRALRWMNKIFLSHLFEEMYRVEKGQIPPKFYALEYLGHKDFINPEVPFDCIKDETPVKGYTTIRTKNNKK